MGRRGPAPKPTALKKAAGNPGRRKLNENEPLPPPGDVTPPDYLSDKSKAIWAELAPVATAMRTLTSADVFAFARYCDTVARYIEVTEFLTKNGNKYPLKTAAGKVRCLMEFPESLERRRLMLDLVALEREFGFTPSARTRIRVEQTPAAAASAPAAPLTGPDLDLQKFFATGGVKPQRKVITG